MIFRSASAFDIRLDVYTEPLQQVFITFVLEPRGMGQTTRNGRRTDAKSASVPPPRVL